MENFFPFFLALSRALLKYLSQCGTTTLHRFSAFKVHKSEGKICFCHPIHIRGRTQPKTIWEKDEAYFSGVKSSTWSENGRTNEMYAIFSSICWDFQVWESKTHFSTQFEKCMAKSLKMTPKLSHQISIFCIFCTNLRLKKNNMVDVKIEMWQFRWFSNTVKKY